MSQGVFLLNVFNYSIPRKARKPLRCKGVAECKKIENIREKNKRTLRRKKIRIKIVF